MPTLRPIKHLLYAIRLIQFFAVFLLCAEIFNICLAFTIKNAIIKKRARIYPFQVQRKVICLSLKAFSQL